MKRLGILLIVSCLGSSLTPAVALAKPEMDFVEGSEKRVSIDLRDTDVIDVLKFLSQKGKFNIFISPNIQGKVTLLLTDVRIIDILDIILLSNGLAHYHNGPVVQIMTQEEYRTRYGEDYSDVRQVKWLRLKYATPAQVFKLLEPTKSKVGSIVVDEQSGTLVLIETPDKMKLMLDLINEVDQPLETRIFDLSYAKAIDVKTFLSTQVDNKGILITPDTRTNQVAVTAPVTRLDEIGKMIASVDRKTREVTIDAQIVKVVLSDKYDQGINWRQMFQQGVLEPLDFNVTLPTAVTAGGSLAYSTLQADGFEVLFKFLKTVGESKILASPRLTVIEGEEAKILIGTREAYVTSTTTTGSSTSTVSESISFIDVGISLAVSALINKEGYVTMKIKPEVSSVVRTLTTPSANEIPIVDTTQAETKVMVRDGTTIVIGGLRKDEKARTNLNVPGLSRIPVVGNLFKNEKISVEQTELIVFLTPHIIEGDKNTVHDQNREPKGIQAYPGQTDPGSGPQTAAVAPAAAAIQPASLKPKGTVDMAGHENWKS